MPSDSLLRLGLANPASPTAPKHFTRGTHRFRAPEQTVRRALELAPRVGITRVANITGLDSVGLPVVSVYRPSSRALVVSQGKGLDLVAARASGLMEAIESYHAERADLPLRLGSLEDLAACRPTVDVTRLPRISTGAFHRHKRMLWCEGRDLATDEPCWVPYEMVHTDFRLPLPAGSGSFTMSSNGLASGNHPLEAISHGICEVIERDAMALWDLGGGSARPDGRIDLGTVDEAECRAICERLSAANLAVGVWDITSDIGIAAFACVIADKEPGELGQIYVSHGSGCHPARAVAWLRALTEAAQTRLTYIAGARDDGDRDFFERARAPSRVAQVLEEIEGGREAACCDFTKVPTREAASFDEDVAWEIERLAGAGISQVIAVDLSRPELGVPVVRVIVPGLEGLHEAPGYVPGPRAQAVLERTGRR